MGGQVDSYIQCYSGVFWPYFPQYSSDKSQRQFTPHHSCRVKMFSNSIHVVIIMVLFVTTICCCVLVCSAKIVLLSKLFVLDV